MSQEQESRRRLLVALAAMQDGSGGEDAAFLAAALQLAERLERLFELPCPDAPGLHLVGAVIGPTAFGTAAVGGRASATGKGRDRQTALLSCLGEAAEYLSRQAWGDETRQPQPPGKAAPLTAFDGPAMAATEGDWTPAHRLYDEAEIWLPASLCFQARPDDANFGAGNGAGRNLESARLHALLELLERDAVALWWLGGRPAALLDPAQLPGCQALLTRLRAGREGRATWFLDIGSDFGVATVAALSCDTDGRGLACGFAARLDVAEAARAALCELCQAEVESHIIALKRRQQGDDALNALERQHLARSRELTVPDVPQLRPRDDARLKQMPLFRGAAHEPSARGLARHLAAHGIDSYGVDLTRSWLGIPAARVLATGLQPMPSEAITSRLAAQIEACGGGAGLETGISVL